MGGTCPSSPPTRCNRSYNEQNFLDQIHSCVDNTFPLHRDFINRKVHSPSNKGGLKMNPLFWVFFYAHQNPPKCKKARIWDQANYIVPESSLHLPPIGPTLDPNTSLAPSNTQHWNAYCSLSLCFWVTLWLERVLFERLGFVWYWTHDCWHVHLNSISRLLFTLTSELRSLGVNKHCPSLPFPSSRQQLITSCRR